MNEEFDEDRFFHAFVERDASYEGIFVVGVVSTGIFCRPTCTARKPKRENVRFFPSPHEALLHGFRPCKVCRPLIPQETAPDWLAPLMRVVSENPDCNIRARDMREMNIDPDRVRRWFKRHHGMTFNGYLRAIRIGRAYGRIVEGESVTTTAFDSGYESLSGFTDAFRKSAGFSPGQSRNERVILVSRIGTPLGPMLAGAVDDGICLLEYVDRRMLETQIKRLRTRLDATVLPGTSRHFGPLKEQLEAYFGGTLHTFDLPLVAPGSEFQCSVWDELRTIPYGETRSYAQQAIRIGKPRAVRAVARANGDNRIAIIIPCHRVIGSDGSLTGYGGGLARKRFLLDLERRSASGSRRAPQRSGNAAARSASCLTASARGGFPNW